MQYLIRQLLCASFCLLLCATLAHAETYMEPTKRDTTKAATPKPRKAATSPAKKAAAKGQPQATKATKAAPAPRRSPTSQPKARKIEARPRAKTTTPTPRRPPPRAAKPVTQTPPTRQPAPRRPAARREIPPRAKRPVPRKTPKTRVVPKIVPKIAPKTRKSPKERRAPTVRLAPKKDKTWWRLSYLLDWGIALGFGAAGVGVYLIEPPVRPFVQSDPTISLKNKPDTISEPLLVGLAGGVPLLTFALAQIWVRSGHDFHHATLGLVEAMSLTFFFTTLLKVTVGRLRPDFIDRCKPDASLNCQGDAAEVTKGRKSFPSGHSSFAFAGGTFLTLYLWGKLRPFDGAGAFWKIPVVMLPMVGATLVAVSRITDNRHHWEDVLVGAMMGMAFASLGYFLNFPAPWADKAALPRRRSRIAVAPLITPNQVGMALQGSF